MNCPRPNEPLFSVCVLRDEFRRLWFYRHQGWAGRAWRQLYQQAFDSGIGPLRRFAEWLKPYLHGISSRVAAIS